MNHDYLDPINSIDMPHRSDSAIALDFLIAAKSSVRNCAVALTETEDLVLREALRRQMEAAIDMRREIADLMMSKGWLHPFDLNKQFKMDMLSAQTAVHIAELPLFPMDTDRMGTFATPEKRDGGAE